MHTLRIIIGGFLLLGVCLLLGRWIGGAAAVVGVAINCFLVLWLTATLINMWVGVSKGYSIKDEAPIGLARICGPRDQFNSDLVENLLIRACRGDELRSLSSCKAVRVPFHGVTRVQIPSGTPTK